MSLSSEIKKRYSCKRKRDWITGTAISMFVLLVLSQLFLILVVPVLLGRHNAWEFHVAKEEVIKQLDGLRDMIRRTPYRNGVQKGEIETVRNVVDQYAIYARNNYEKLNWQQVAQMKRIFGQYEAVCIRWYSTPPRFYVTQESVGMPEILSRIENETQENP